MRTRVRGRPGPVAAVACGVLLLAGCAEFDDSAGEQSWRPAPQLTPEAGPQPDLPEVDRREIPQGPDTSREPVPPPDGCTDYDKAVLATCLDTVSAVTALPTDGSTITALAGERRSGRVLRVGTDGDQEEIATLDVTAGGDGGLTALTLSPSYAEDRLVYAYVTTDTDNRVVRFAEGRPAKPVLTGIPKGESGNGGALLATDGDTLLVATGDAGDPAAARDAGSLAGKVLRIDTSGAPAEGNPTPDSPVYASGVHSPGGLCADEEGSRTWVTDRGTGRDAVYRVDEGGTLSTPAWTWPDRPGVTGCADWGDVLVVAMADAANVQNLPLNRDGSVGGEPQVTMDGEQGPDYGRYGSLATVTSDIAVAGTANKDGGEPVSSDDRVVLIVRQPASGSGPD
nr:PQQ-dependent sugar dehydrogenase [Saccharomonospora iraqiensis]